MIRESYKPKVSKRKAEAMHDLVKKTSANKPRNDRTTSTTTKKQQKSRDIFSNNLNLGKH